MSAILKKEQLHTNEVICQKYSQTSVDCDVIVPDINPDILKVLEVDGFVSIKEKSIRQGKIYVHGTAYMTMLYVPDGEVLSKVKALVTTQEFVHTIDVPSTDDDVTLCLEIEPESFNHTLINSRKVNLRCTVGINAKLTTHKSIELATDIEDASGNICTDTANIRICNAIVNSENRLNICEQLELPSGKPGIGELLKTTVCPQSLEFTLSEGEATAKGQVRICSLYSSVDDGSIQFVEYTIPFEKEFELPGAEDDMEGEIEYTLTDMYCEIRDDSDGEPRILGIDLGLCALIKGMYTNELAVIKDAYSLYGIATITSREISLEQLMDNTTAQITHKTSASLPGQLPEIYQVCNVSAQSSVDRLTSENDEITLFGHIKCNILYLSSDEAMPLCSFEEISEFTHTFHVSNADAHTLCDAKVFTEHVGYTMNGGDSLDLRIVLGLNVRSFKNENFTQITDIEVSEPEDKKPDPCIIIYFVQHGDTLWKIAKKYRTTVAALMECNNLSSDRLDIGQQLRICR